ncbi:MAG: hypothetical protein AAF714_09955 [Pseudomonadota bacterium]
MTGSTNFKNSDRGRNIREGDAFPIWVEAFHNFYKDFPAEFYKNYNSARSQENRDDRCPVLWKAVGDELVFCGLVGSKLSVKLAIDQFQKTLYSYRKRLQDDHYPLDLKGAAWVASFPFPNLTVELKPVAPELSVASDGEEQDGDAAGQLLAASEALERAADQSPFDFDFLGKAIDTGFRVASNATKERFLLSVQLARIVLTIDSMKDQVRIDQPVEMKGVNSGEPYPLLYLDTLKHLKTIEIRQSARSLFSGGTHDASEILNYVNQYCRAVGTDEFELAEEPSSGELEPPQFYLDQVPSVARFLEQEAASERQIKEAAQADDTASTSELEGASSLKPLSSSSDESS